MKILVACEESQAVTKELRALGHTAFSCDIVECSGGFPEWHIKDDVIPLLNINSKDTWEVIRTSDGKTHEIDKWDMIIAFPPCTHLAVSGARHFEKKRADGRQRYAIEFFSKILNADCEKIAVENPVNIIGGNYIKEYFPEYSNLPNYTQKIQPYEYGDPVRKGTCLWLKNLPKLKPTNIVEPEIINCHYKNKDTSFSGAAWYVTDDNGKILSWRDPRTAKVRSKTYPGIAKAMAEQWGGVQC